MDVISYALSKKIAEHAVSGVQSMSVSGQTLTINTKDSGVLTMTFPKPRDGVSVTDIDVNANNQIVFTMSDGTEFISGKIPTVKGDKGDAFTYSDFTQEQLESLKGQDGFSPSAKIEKVGDTATITITDKDGTTTATIKDGQGGGTADVPIEKIKVNGELQTPVNKVVDITVPDAYDDTDIRAELANKADTDHTHTTVNGHTVESDVPVDAKFTDTVYDDTQVKTQIQAVANGLMDSVGYSADYKTIDIIAKNGVKKSVNVAPIISHASITELSDVDTTNKATGKALVYNATTSKHEYADVSGTDEKVKMDASTDAKYLSELLDNITIANENGELKVKKLDGQEVTITEINYLKGLTMNVMDLVNMFSNGGVKIINTPVATYAELLTLDKSSFIEGISYLVYVLADENHDNAKTTYLVDKDSETPTYFGFADSQRDFTTNPIDLATEITGKLGISNMDSDAIKALFTVDDTYKTETVTNNAFSTHGAKALYDELLLAIGNKANDSDLTAHKDDVNIHVSTEDRTKWDSAKTHADSAHAPSNAQENVLETVKVNGTALEVSDKAVNVTVPTKVSELTDSADYAKTTDIPTTLPANGGNADTVNNHTVETDVPVDAVFTDTLYDDTSVKSSISALQTQLGSHTVKKDVPADAVFTDTNTWRDVTTSLTSTATDVSLAASAGKNLQDQITTVNSNLDNLQYSDIAGDKNLWSIEEKTYTNSISDRENDKFQALIKLNGENVVQKTIRANGRHELCFNIVNKGLNNLTLIHSGVHTDILFVSSDFNCDAGDYVLSFNVDGWDASVIGGIRFNNIQLEKGTTATDFEPYIPSIKMLEDEVAAQNESLSVIGKCKNLLNPTLRTTTTQNGVKCTNNGDGTYTVSGTNSTSENITFIFSIPNNGKGKGKLVGCPQTSDAMLQTYYNGSWGYSNTWDKGNGSVLDKMELLTSLSILVYPGKTVNLTFKPMLTTNLNATYDDFVPYTGDGDTLTEDVAELKNDLSVIGKCKNLLNPTLKTSTSNGITCTDNGDGTYTLNGTATEWGFFNLNYKNLSTKSIPVGIYKVVGGVKDISLEVMASSKSLGGDSGNGYTFEIKTTDTNSWLRVVFSSGKTFNNVLIKPMLTTNLSATYDDFVPYTGDGETLASDVAEIKKDLGGLECGELLDDSNGKASVTWSKHKTTPKSVFGIATAESNAVFVTVSNLTSSGCDFLLWKADGTRAPGISVKWMAVW